MSKAVLVGIEQLKAENTRLLAEIEQLEAEAAVLREALEAVKWVFHTGTGYCHWCQRTFRSGHAPDCLRELALATDAGRPLLAEVEYLQAEAAALREALEQLMSVDFLTWEAEAGGTPCEDWYDILDSAKDVLASDAGHAPLERLRRAEFERDEWKRKWEAAIVQFAEESKW